MTDLTNDTNEVRSSGSAFNAGLAPCPCGRPMDKLTITDAGQGGKYAWVAGNCCGEWSIEFRTKYQAIHTAECMDLAIKAWNSAPRVANNK